MATTNFKGQSVKLIGEFIQVGKVAPGCRDEGHGRVGYL